MPTYTDPVFIDGTQDTTQLKVQSHTTQTAPLQTWEASNAAVLSQVTSDGRLQIGDDMTTPDALVEAHRLETSTAKPKRGFHSLGLITDALNAIVAWSVHELTLKGTAGIQALHTALRVRLRNENSGANNSTAQLRGLDVEVSNAGATIASPIAQLTGLRVGVLTESTGNTDTAYGVKVEFDTLNTQTAYAFHADTGKMRPGALLEIPNTITSTVSVPSGFQSSYIEELIVTDTGELIVDGAVFVLF